MNLTIQLMLRLINIGELCVVELKWTKIIPRPLQLLIWQKKQKATLALTLMVRSFLLPYIIYVENVVTSCSAKIFVGMISNVGELAPNLRASHLLVKVYCSGVVYMKLRPKI